MAQNIYFGNLRCQCSDEMYKESVAYILYPMDHMLDHWIDGAAKKYATTIVVISGMDWQNVLSPWPAIGVPEGTPDFAGQAPDFLMLLRRQVLPRVESALGIGTNLERTLVGVSMSGLFALWQWAECDDFVNIASLSGSFWYEGFMQWLQYRSMADKRGMAYFLLGDKEAHSRTKAFKSVGANTEAIVDKLREEGVRVTYEMVPGNHYADPITRLDKAFASLYAK